MEKKSETLMTRREALKSAGKISASALVASTIPGIIANASETLSEAAIDLTERSKLRCLCTVLRMGHCAPSVMGTLIDGRRDARYEHMIKITSGMPGGIGKIGAECGAVTSPIMFLGRELGYDTSNGETPMVISLGRRYVNMFRDLHGSIYCRDIRTPDSGISPCRRAICGARGLLVEAIDGDSGVPSGDYEGESKNAHAMLLKSFRGRGFHCTHSVLNRLSDVIDVNEDLMRASWGFLGGTLLLGQTCGALTAGVLAIGSKIGEIEDSYLRSIRMLIILNAGGDGMRDDLNKFNRPIRIGNELATWFEEKYKSTNCSNITGLDLSTTDGVETYLSENRTERCLEITENVALKVRSILVD